MHVNTLNILLGPSYEDLVWVFKKWLTPVWLQFFVEHLPCAQVLYTENQKMIALTNVYVLLQQWFLYFYKKWMFDLCIDLRKDWDCHVCNLFSNNFRYHRMSSCMNELFCYKCEHICLFLIALSVCLSVCLHMFILHCAEWQFCFCYI